MSLAFYPHADEVPTGTLDVRIEILLEAARDYKAVVLDSGAKSMLDSGEIDASDTARIIRTSVPREIEYSYNWDDIALVLREVRDLSEASKEDKSVKSRHLMKLAEVYEVLRGAKMSKLEAVRLALVNEAKQLQSGSTPQVI